MNRQLQIHKTVSEPREDWRINLPLLLSGTGWMISPSSCKARWLLWSASGFKDPKLCHHQLPLRQWVTGTLFSSWEEKHILYKSQALRVKGIHKIDWIVNENIKLKTFILQKQYSFSYPYLWISKHHHLIPSISSFYFLAFYLNSGPAVTLLWQQILLFPL